MKRYILALTVIVISLVMNAQDSDILMTLGKNKVTKDDFEYLFLKNRTNVKTKPQTIDEYLQTYKKFRLKVIDAEALGYDTLDSFRKELDSYRNQMAIGYLTDKDKSVLKTFAVGDNLWLQRIAIVSTLWFIRKGILKPTFEVSLLLLDHRHDLIHKAVGWMLREAGKKDFDAEYAFLTEGDRYRSMPRTMLRYAIEKFPETLRQQFLKGEV